MTNCSEYDSGLRYDAGKLRYDLLPFQALEEVTKVFTYGATKYEPRNWEKGFSWMRVFACLMRHLLAWVQGEDRDAESGCHHLAHVIVNSLFLLQFHFTLAGTDDRVKPQSQNARYQDYVKQFNEQERERRSCPANLADVV